MEQSETSLQFTGKELVDFLRKDYLIDWKDEDILQDIITSSSCDGLAMVARGNRLSAVALVFPYGSRWLHIKRIKISCQDDLRILIGEYLKRFEGRTLTANRGKRFKIYTNTSKLLRRLWTNDKQQASQQPSC